MLLLALGLPACSATTRNASMLESWNDGATKATIVEFVERVTDTSLPDYVPPAERVAVFDNDGTLWAEQPLYFQLIYALDRINATAADHPEWKTTQPFKAVLENDKEALVKSGKEGLMKLIAATHAGITENEFSSEVDAWLSTAKHPRFDVAYRELIYQPQVELLQYLRSNGFKTFIVSGGGIDYIRVFSQDAYGIPPEQVVGSSLKANFEMRDGKPVVVKVGELNFIDDKEGKPVGIHQHIGRKPVIAVGNSDGDLQMLQYTTIGRSPSLGVIIRHDDAEREYAYDRDSHIGKLDKALDEAPRRGWVVVSMKNDWKRVFPE